ncbi:MAG: peptidase associated/transthyretin-like domain-containing protein [Planctomycetota bacterium]
MREAELLLERGRAATEKVPRAWIRRAAKLARSKPRLFAVVFDSWFEPRPALRRAGITAAPRFLRFEGPLTIDLEIASDGTVLGQLEPPQQVREVRIEAGGRVRRAKVGPDGTFRFRSLPRGSAALEVDGQRIEDLPI